MGTMGGGPSVGRMLHDGPWWHAFGTGGVEGEPPLLEGRLSSLSFFRHSLCSHFYASMHAIALGLGWNQ